MTPKQLKELVKFCRANGVKKVTFDPSSTVSSLEFSEAALLPEKKPRGLSKMALEKGSEETQPQYSDEETLMWSSQGYELTSEG